MEGKNPYEDALKAIAAPELRDEMDEPHKNLARCLIVWACTLDGFGDLLFQPDYFELPASLDAVGARSAAQALRVIHKNLFADLDLPFAGKRVSGGELFKRIDQAFSIFRDWRESEGLEKEFRDAVVRYLLSHHVY